MHRYNTLIILVLLGIEWIPMSSVAFQASQPQSRERVLTGIKLKASLSSEEIRMRLITQLEKLRQKDRQAKFVSKDDLVIVWEDESLVVVDKPSGVLSVASEEGIPSLAQCVFENTENSFSSYDRMVIHRLGTDTSGLIVFAKTMEALRGMNALFRTRQVLRQYEVLVCGHVLDDKGTIDMPLMRDYLHPPFMRISTDEHQKALMALDPAIVGKKLLEAPKPSQTHFEVVTREKLKDSNLPVTRLRVTSITGRTHQLNVHCAAFGHPIVGDRVYGLRGEAAPYGGIDVAPDMNGAADVDLQSAIAAVVDGMNMCVHATHLRFRHPVTNLQLDFNSPAPF